jgi:hypothetical protein
MSDLNIRTIVEALTKPEVQRRRTRIEDLSDVGYELSEEHLQVVTGGNPKVGQIADKPTRPHCTGCCCDS